MVSKVLLKKESRLAELVRSVSPVVVAFSGGVDSTYLAYIANRELGDAAICVTGISPSVSSEQRERSASIAEKHGFNRRIVETQEIEDPRYSSNPVNRCYFCKKELYGTLEAIAREADGATVFDGTNADDLSDHRPGRAAAKEHGVASPLAELGFTKQDIRDLSRLHGLETWDIPASPCLSSRIPYGTPVTIGRLSRIDRGESYLRDLGFREFRVRSYGEKARLEFSEPELPKAVELESNPEFSARFLRIGFESVAVERIAFRSGSLNKEPGHSAPNR